MGFVRMFDTELQLAEQIASASLLPPQPLPTLKRFDHGTFQESGVVGSVTRQRKFVGFTEAADIIGIHAVFMAPTHFFLHSLEWKQKITLVGTPGGSGSIGPYRAIAGDDDAISRCNA